MSVFVLQLTAAWSAGAQAPRAITFAKPNAEVTETFTAITSIRELSDGRVIVSDSRDKAVKLVDFSTQKLTTIGRLGSGPAEYQSPGTLYALSGDSSLLQDFANSRYLVINPDGKAGATRTFVPGPVDVATHFGMDERGVNYYKVRPTGSREEGGVQAIVRLDATTKRADTITTITRPLGLMSGASAIGGGMLKMFTNLPFAAEDAAVVAGDGRIAVARANPYHVEWFPKGAKGIVGPAISFKPIEITAAEKRAFLEKQVRPGSITVRNDANASAKPAPVATSSQRQMFTAETYDDKGMTWPATKPPFVGNALSVDGAGRLWVLRTTPHTMTQMQYDVFDATAKLIMTVTLPPKTRVAGFGRKSVYLAFSDEDDLLHLQRFAAP